MNDNTDAYFALSVIANICQLASFDMNIQQTSSDDIMKELQHQDKILDEQINLYLKKIIEQNETIIKLLDNGSIAKR